MIRGIEGRWNLTLRTMEADFERALRLTDERELSGLKALIGYYQIYELQRKRISFAAQERCIEVRKQSHAMHNYLRALYLDNLEALGLSYLRAYEIAYSRLQTLLKNIEYAKDEYLHFCVAQNAILVLCVMGRFSEALVLMQKENCHHSINSETPEHENRGLFFECADSFILKPAEDHEHVFLSSRNTLGIQTVKKTVVSDLMNP